MNELPADRYHAGVRLGVLAVWLGAAVVLFLAGQGLAGLLDWSLAGAGTILLGIGALAGAQLLATLGERQLLERWPSGRAVRLETGGLRLRDQAGEIALDLGRPLSFWRWRFVVRGRRGGRVPNGHVCMALRLVQDQAVITVYSFLPPASAEALAGRYVFYQVQSAKETARPLLGGREAVYLAAENDRWERGAELEPAHFGALLDHVARTVPDFSGRPSS